MHEDRIERRGDSMHRIQFPDLLSVWTQCASMSRLLERAGISQSSDHLACICNW